MTMIWVGIDPGQKGAFAVISEGESSGDTVRVFPWDDREFIMQMKMISYIYPSVSGNVVACVERVGAMSHQGVKSMFSFGKSAGFIEGVLRAFDIPYQLIPPTVWKREFSLIKTEKRASIEVAKRLMPEVSFLPSERCRVESDGMADAALMALYAKRHFGGQTNGNTN